MIIGVDEAGKGPVLGSMFVVGIRSKGFEYEIPDSKKLSDSRRENIYENLIGSCEFFVVEVSSDEIDKMNMNDLVINAHSKIISNLYEDGDSVFCDACLGDESKYKEKLLSDLDVDKDDIICENKADENYDIVGAASVIAKQRREMYISEIDKKFDMSVGSGYPSDSTTLKFLEWFYNENNEFPDFARKSWNTCDKVRQSSLDNF